MPSTISGNAIYTYWNHPTSIEVDGVLWTCGITSNGTWRIFKNDNTNYADLGIGQIDDHNSPAIAIGSGKMPIVFYTEHGVTPYIRYRRITEDETGQIVAGEEQFVHFGEQTTYVNVMVKDDVILLITRSGATTWKYCVSYDWASSWTQAATFIDGGEGSKPYCLARPTEETEYKYHLAAYGHPTESLWNIIVSGTIDMNTGDIARSDGTIVANVFLGTGLPLGTTSLEEVYNPGAGNSRLLDIGDKKGRQIVYYARWTGNDPSTKPDYWQAVRKPNGGWEHSYIVSSGGNFEGTSRQYLGGIAIDRSGRDIVYISRKSGSNWLIEEWDIDLRLQAYSPHPLATATNRLIRPYVPDNTSNLIYQNVTVYNSYIDYMCSISKV
jgi:hypothetical protein